MTTKRCRNNYSRVVFDDLKAELSEMVEKWSKFSDIVAGDWISFIKPSIATHRMEQLFEIVVLYPESGAVAKELGSCVGNEYTMLSAIADSLNKSIKRRLLHQGVPTTDILNGYISAIMGLNDIDSTGILVRIVCEPIRQHLKGRKGIVHAVVSALTDNSLLESNYNNLSECTEVVDELMEDIDTKDWRDWRPRPVFNHQIERDLGMRSSDLLTLLSSIYGTKESLLKEYREALADKIINSRVFDVNKEHRALKILRDRFGDQNLHKAEVMLFDMVESIQLFGENERILTQGEMWGCLMSVTVISDQFWPEQNVEMFKLPRHWEMELAKYEKSFLTSKNNRSLTWMPNIGLMTLAVEHEGVEYSITTTPAMAAILHCFTEKDEMEYSEIADKLQFEDSRALKTRLDHWISQGVLVGFEKNGTLYIKIRKMSSFDLLLDCIIEPMDETEKDTVSAGSQSLVLLEKYWAQALRMLKLMPTVTVQKIYSAMRLFAHTSGNVSSCFTVADVIVFVDTRIELGEVVKNDNIYTFP